MSFVEQDAQVFATEVHDAAGNMRKYVGGPYIVHPAEVVEILRRFTADIATLATAWLHDVKDDAGVTHSMLAARFGDEVASLVEWVSIDVGTQHLSRRERVERAILKIGIAPAKAQNVKAADTISNCKSISLLDPKFARTYLPEKARALSVMTAADPDLLAEAWSVVRQAAEVLSVKLHFVAQAGG